MRVKITEVARVAGVSSATVSKVLSGRAGYSVHAATAERVRQTAIGLGYVADVAARNLRTRQTGQLGVVMEAVGSSEPDSLLGGVTVGSAVRRTFDGALMAGLSDAARRLEVAALVVYPGGREATPSYFDGRVDGLLLSGDPLRGHALLELFQDAPLPLVALWTGAAPSGMSTVDIDHRGGAVLATEHLISLGHTRTAFYGGGVAGGVEHFRRREEGFRQAMLAAGLRPMTAIHDGQVLVEAVRRGEISAVFAETDLAAAAAWQAMNSAGLRVPDDVSLVGFDDILGAEFIAGGLSTVYHPAAEMAAEGVNVLLKRLNGAAVSQTLLPTRLILRRSTRRV